MSNINAEGDWTPGDVPQDPPRQPNTAAQAHADAIVALVNEVVANTLENVARYIELQGHTSDARQTVKIALETEARRRRQGQ